MKKDVGQTPKKTNVSDETNKEMLKKWYKASAAPLAVPGGLMMGALRPNSTVKKEWEQITKDYPDSALEVSTGSDLLGDVGMESGVARELLGLGVDVATDPTTLLGLASKAATAGAKTIYPSASNKLLRELGEKMKVKGAADFVEANIKQKNFDRGLKEPLTKLILQENLQDKMGDPAALRKIVSGEKSLDEAAESLGILRAKKKDGGLKGKAGEKISEVIERSNARAPGVKINRMDMVNDLVKKQNSRNNTPGVEALDLDSYEKNLRATFNPQTELKVTRQAPPSTKTPLLPIQDLDKELKDVTEKISGYKDMVKGKEAEKSVYEASKKKVAKANEDLSKLKENAVADEVTSREALKRSQVKGTQEVAGKKKAVVSKSEKEREASLSAIDRENQSAAKYNESLESEVEKLMSQLDLKKSDIEPLDSIPVPGKTKGLPDIPAKERADILLHNKKAKESLGKYMQKNELPAEDVLESAISKYKGKMRPTISPDDVPPALTEEMVDLKAPAEWPQIPNKIKNDEILSKAPVELDTPPPTPIGSEESLESLIAKQADIKGTKADLHNANRDIVQKNRASDLQSVPQETVMHIDNYSDIADLHEIKKTLNQRLKDVYKRKNEPDFKNKEALLLEQQQEVDNALMAELSNVELPEGNAGLLFKQSNNKFGMLSQLDDLLKPVEAAERKQGSKYSRLMTRVGGAAAAGGATAMSGGNAMQTAAATTAGAVGADIARKFSEAAPENLGKWGTRLSDPDVAQVVGQTAAKTYVKPGREMEEVPEITNEDEIDFSMMNGRKPQSVEEPAQPMPEQAPGQDPIHTKMDETLNPEQPMWDPYINEEVLNTFLPRDSERILKNPEALIAKLQQVAPNQLPMIRELLEGDPETLKEAGPMLAMQFPAVFEKDKYGAFDGKITDPMMQQKFLMDLSNDESMDSIAKAKMAMKLHQGESIY